MNLSDLTISQIHKSLLQKKISSTELVRCSLDKIRKLDPKIQAFLTVCEDSSIAKAKKQDEKIAKGEFQSLISGIPYSAKDVFSTKRVKTTASSKILENYIPVYSATTVEKIEKAGGILIGKTNNDAFGFGSSCENSDFQITRNPWDLERVPGGSSGGSAAAVISDMGMFSLAEDTGGSIRQPASFCSTTGIKVTYGRVSRYGVIAYGSSLDTIGVIGKNAQDTALVTQIIAGRDKKDATTLKDKVPNYLFSINAGISDVKIGIPKEYFISGIDREVEELVQKAVLEFEKLGANLENVSLPYTKYAVPSYYLSGISEVSANLARYDGIRFGYWEKDAETIEDLYLLSRGNGFGEEVKRRVMLGTYALSSGYYDAYYKKAQKVRTLIKKDFDKVFKKVDMLITPVSPTAPFKIGDKSENPLKMWLSDIFTVTINPAGVPALSLPCGFTKKGLPVGMQLVGPQLSEELLFQAGHAYQKATDWHKKRPEWLNY